MTKMTVLMAAILLLAAGVACGPLAQTGESDRTVTEAQYEQWKTDLSNWERWGADDEIGALNLVTPAKRLEAVAVVRDGFTVSLAGDANTVEAVDNPFPYEHEMVSISSDRIAVQYHGISAHPSSTRWRTSTTPASSSTATRRTPKRSPRTATRRTPSTT